MSDAVYGALWRSGLLKVGAIARRELGAFFVSPVGWVVGMLIVFPVSFFGYLTPLLSEQLATMERVFSLIPFLMVFLMPLYTMRLLAEEHRSGTLEILLTTPVRDWELVLGKWLGGFLFYLASIAFTLVYVVLIMQVLPLRVPLQVLGLHLEVANLDYGLILSGYVGLIVVGGMFAAIGLLASSVTQNQIVAAFTGIVALLFLWYLGLFSGFLQPPLSAFFDYAAGSTRFAAFPRGQIALRDLAYFATVTAAALFVAVRVLESRKWR